MDLTSVSNTELLNRVDKLARSERKITHLILWHLVEVETRRLFIDLGYTSLFKYMTAHLHYSEDAAYRRIQAARLLKKVPQLNHAVENGDINLSQLHRVQKCITNELENGNAVSLEKTEEVLELIQNKSSMETQKILAVEFNQPIQLHETIKPQRDDSSRMEITFTHEQMQDLQHAKELLSHVLPNPTWAELFSYMAKSQIQRKLGTLRKRGVVQETMEENKKNYRNANGSECADYYKKSEKTDKTGESDEADMLAAKKYDQINKRSHIKLSTRRFVMTKSSHSCEFIHSDGNRCGSKFQLQIDHKRPLALGGTNGIENFRVLCRAHNLSEARRMRISKY